MAWTALLLLVVFGIVCIGVRTWMHVRQTGRSPFLRGPVGHGLLAVLAFTGPFIAAIVLDLTGSLERLVDSGWVAAAGVTLAVIGVATTMWAQLAMGASWRVGIDPDERTALVTGGPYRLVRNPIYTAMFTFVVGLALVLPNIASLLGVVVVVAVIDVIVRRVEEPYLVSVHGPAYRQWATTAGRFLPGIGRDRASTT